MQRQRRTAFAQHQQARHVIDLRIHQKHRADAAVAHGTRRLQFREGTDLAQDVGGSVDQNPVGAVFTDGDRRLGASCRHDAAGAQAGAIEAVAVPLRESATCSGTENADFQDGVSSVFLGARAGSASIATSIASSVRIACCADLACHVARFAGREIGDVSAAAKKGRRMSCCAAVVLLDTEIALWLYRSRAARQPAPGARRRCYQSRSAIGDVQGDLETITEVDCGWGCPGHDVLLCRSMMEDERWSIPDRSHRLSRRLLDPTQYSVLRPGSSGMRNLLVRVS